MSAKLASVAFLLVLPASAGAQAADAARVSAFASVGYASTWDDEGLLGRGASVAGGAGYRVTRRLWVHAMVERVPYHRDVEWLTFDGRVLFAGVEGSFQSQRKTTRPYVTFGYGIADNNGVWIQKTLVAPGQPRIDDRVTLDGTFRAATPRTS